MIYNGHFFLLREDPNKKWHAIVIKPAPPEVFVHACGVNL